MYSAAARGWTLASDDMGVPTTGSVRWPVLIVAIGLVVVLGLRARPALGPVTAALLVFVTSTTFAFIDRSWPDFDFLGGVAIVGALLAILRAGAPLGIGVCASLAFLAAGWPPLIAIGLCGWILRGHPTRRTLFSVLPVVAAVFAWSWWALRDAGLEAWAAALALPFTESPRWFFVLELILQSLPWSPLALLAVSPSIRACWSRPGRRWVLGWVRILVVLTILGTLIPGFANAVRIPAIAALAVISAASLAAVAISANRKAQSTFRAIALVIALPVAVVATPLLIHVALAIAYYRPIAILLACTTAAAGVAVLASILLWQPRHSIAALVLVAFALKGAHAGIFAPEWNYRVGQGPWGRAIGQWIPPRASLHTLVRWPDDLAFYMGRNVRLLRDATFLADSPESPSRPHYVLLTESEFSNWPEYAPRLVVVREFPDYISGVRVLARTANAREVAQADARGELDDPLAR
jgi:hypothetical protein